MSNTPAAPAQKAEASVRTWVNSQWQPHPKPGRLSVAINTLEPDTVITCLHAVAPGEADFHESDLIHEEHHLVEG